MKWRLRYFGPCESTFICKFSMLRSSQDFAQLNLLTHLWHFGECFRCLNEATLCHFGSSLGRDVCFIPIPEAKFLLMWIVHSHNGNGVNSATGSRPVPSPFQDCTVLMEASFTCSLGCLTGCAVGQMLPNCPRAVLLEPCPLCIRDQNINLFNFVLVEFNQQKMSEV